MSLAEDLADRLEHENEQLIALLDSLNEAQWGQTAVNTPEVRMNDEDESRPVGVIAHHVASTYPVIAAIAQGLAEGPAPAALSAADIQRMNREHAASHPLPAKPATIELLRSEGSRAAALIRGWTDEQLERESERPGSRSARQFLELVMLGHPAMHRLSIEATTRADAEPSL